MEPAIPIAKNTRATIIPTMRYRDAPAAIEWSCRAFEFERHLVVRDEAGGIAHAQLSLGNGMIMLAAQRDDKYGRLLRQPDSIDGGETQAPYVIVADPYAHYAQAKAAGAIIVLDIKTEDYGGRSYTCPDL